MLRRSLNWLRRYGLGVTFVDTHELTSMYHTRCFRDYSFRCFGFETDLFRVHQVHPHKTVTQFWRRAHPRESKHRAVLLMP